MNNTHRDDTNDDDHGKLVFLQYSHRGGKCIGPQAGGIATV